MPDPLPDPDPDEIERHLHLAVWGHDQPPEQIDRDAIAAYNRHVIAEAANITRPGSIDWVTVTVWILGVTGGLAALLGIRWAIAR